MKDNTGFENLRVYKLSEELSDAIWDIVLKWNSFAMNTVGNQLVRAADSVGANIAEGTGRKSFIDNKRFVKISIGSFNETKHWLRRAFKRNLLTEKQTNDLKIYIDELGPKLHAYLNSIGNIPTSASPVTSDK